MSCMLNVHVTLRRNIKQSKHSKFGVIVENTGKYTTSARLLEWDEGGKAKLAYSPIAVDKRMAPQ